MQSLSIVFDRGLETKITDYMNFQNDGQKLTSGILIGQRTPTAIHVVHLAKTGANFETVPDDVYNDTSPKQGGKKSTSQQRNEAAFDDQAILQHVRQAVRTLPGGLDVVGFFVASSSANKKYAENLASCNKAIRSAYKICSKISGIYGSTATTENVSLADGRMVLLTLDLATANNKKPVSTLIVDCRPDAQTTAPSTVVPFSYQNLRWRQLSTRLVFDVPLFVSEKHSQDSFLKQFADSIRPWFNRLLNATATINGNLRDDDELLISTVSSGKSGKGKQTADENSIDFVDFYLVTEPYSPSNQISDAKAENGAVTMRIRGTMYCLAFLHQKATVAEGLRALKVDAFKSLYGRCELHYDGMAVLEGEELDPVAVHQFPRRVLASLTPNSNLLVSDYLFEGDVSSDAVSSFQDILGIEVQPGMIEDKLEKVPSEKALEKLLRSSSFSTTSESSVDDLEKVKSQELKEHYSSRRRRISLIYFALSILIGLFAYLYYALFKK